MARRSQTTPTEGELEILKVLWDRGPSTVREVLTVLNAKRQRAYTSVMSILNIMANKGQVPGRPRDALFSIQLNGRAKKPWAKWSALC